jgi:hypothetical protein
VVEAQDGVQPPTDANLAGELAAAAQTRLHEVESLFATLKDKIVEVEFTRVGVAAAAEATQAKLLEANTAATAVIAVLTQVTDEQAVIASKSAHIQGAQEHADKVRAELDRIQTVATQHATGAEGQRTRAETATDTVNELLAAVRGHRTSAETELAATIASRDLAKTAAATSKVLADKSENVEERIMAYEARLVDLEAQCKAQLETITGLLPGATSAGLAHAFDDRRKTFLNPATRWQWIFVGSVGALVLLALTGLWNVYSATSLLGWDDLARLWLARLPIAGALIWLALHASRESALAKRLEEDYGYKAAIATSFQGFQKQMADIGTSAAAGSPLSKLCDDTLSTIASPPGRIYDKHRLTVSPTSEFTEAMSPVKPGT